MHFKTFVFLFCALTIASTLTYAHYTEKRTSLQNDAAIRTKRGIIRQTVKLIGGGLKTSLSPARRWLRIRKAKETLLIGARYLEDRSGVKFYDKSGGQFRALQDFDMLRVFNVKEEIDATAGGLRKYGTIGDNVVEFVQHYSESIPYPVVYMYKIDYSRSRSAVTMVMYKN